MNAKINNLIESELIHRLGWSLLHSIWILALVGLLTAAAMILLGKRSPQARYACAYLGLILMAVVPLAMFASFPVKEVNYLREETAIPSTSESPIIEPTDSRPLLREPLPVPINSKAPLSESMPAPNLPVIDATPILQDETQASSSWAMAVPWSGLIWLVGIVILSFWRVGGWLTARRMQSLGSPVVSGRVGATVEQLRKILKVSTPVRVLQSSLVQVPAVFGWLKPTIFLPMQIMESLTGAQLRMVLAHELAHIRRNDYLANLVQTCIETLLFFHPAVWWVSRHIRIERENCCDDLAVHYCGHGADLAGALVAVEQGRSEALPNPALAATGGDTEKRIRRLLGISCGRRDRIGLSAFSMLFGLGLFVLIGFFIAGPSAAQIKATKAEEAPAEEATEAFETLYKVLMTRYGPDGKAYAENESAPVILPESVFPFGDKTYQKLTRALDDFAALPQKKIESLSDIQRAIMQRHLWKVYDMSHPEYWRKSNGEETVTLRSHPKRREAVRPQIASLIKRVALPREKIQALPNTLGATIKAGLSPSSHDPKDLFKSFLPTEIHVKGSAWVCLGDRDPRKPVPADVHAQKFNWRSTFTSFIRAPGGRENTLKCIEKFNRQEELPVGTQFALIEQAFLISDQGEQVLSPLVFSVSLRAYVGKGVHRRTGEPIAEQSVAEFLIQPRQLMEGNAVMKALSKDDTRYEVGDADCFSGGIEDTFEFSSVYVRPRLQQCRHCHGGDSPNYVKRLGLFTARPGFLGESRLEDITKATSARKQDDKTWKALLDYLKMK